MTIQYYISSTTFFIIVIFFITDQDSQFSFVTFIQKACEYNMIDGDYVFYFADVNNIFSPKQKIYQSSNDITWGDNLNEIFTFLRDSPAEEMVKMTSALKTLKRSFLISTWIDATTMDSSRLKELLNCTKGVAQVEKCKYEKVNLLITERTKYRTNISIYQTVFCHLL